MGYRRSDDIRWHGASRTGRRGVWFLQLTLAAIICISLLCASGAAAEPVPSGWHVEGAGSRSSGVAQRAGRSFSQSTRLFPSKAFTPREVSPTLAGADGGISGQVTATATKKGIEGIEVCAFANETEYEGDCVITSGGGEYTLANLQPGSYTVEFAPPFESGLNYIRQFYDDQRSESEAEEVHVAAGGVTSGIDAALSEGGEIEGNVTDIASEALERIEVCALEAVTEFVERCGMTNDQGKYTIVGLSTGEYHVAFSVSFASEQNFAPQLYDGASSVTGATLVSVVAESVKSGIDAVLSPGGQITGTVASFSTGAGLQGIEVCAFADTVGVGYRCTTTGPRGDYDLIALGTAEYRVVFFSPSGEFMTQYYEGASSLSDANDVAVLAGSTNENIDAALKQEVPIDVEVPRISGSATEGQTLRVVHGSWMNAPTSYKDEWGLCAASGEITSCHTVAVGESYTLTSTDVGHAIRVRESATNAGGTGKFAFSLPTSSVAALPPPPIPPLSPGASSPPVLPHGAGRVLGSTTTAPSASQIKAMLLSVLTPTGKGAKIGVLLARDGYAVSPDAVSAGQLVIAWYLVPKGAHLAAGRPVLVAIGRLSVSKSGKTHLTIRLTGKGRAMLKHTKRITLTADGVFTPSGGGPVQTIRSFALRH
jgi:hypothetical protein